jgi:hypothetical protein
MRYLFGFMCVLALGVMGCGETSGAGGSGGDGGTGGTGGSDLCLFVTCTDNDCRSDGVCDASDGMCDYTLMADGTACAGGMCQAGVCELTGTVLPCTEQGIRNAIAAGGGPYTFDCDGPTTVVTEATVDIDNDVILDGEGNLTVDGDKRHTVFWVEREVTAELRGLTVTGGVGASGGGILTVGTLTLTNSTVSGNTALRTGGSGILNAGTLTLTNSTVSGNDGSVHGGAISGGGTLTLTNSTVSGNDDVGIAHSGTVTLTNSTVSGNSGAGIDIGSGTLTMANSLVDGECLGSVTTTNGYNIESPGNTCGFDQPSDQVDVTEGQLDLGPLQDNGGPTMTHALGADSVAIDHIPVVDCEVDEDQRGVLRPQGDACDVGSFELQPPPAEGCTQSGGTVSTGLCCQAVESFPSTCAVGACGCAPDASHEVAVCICPTNACFDGERCVAE